MIAWGFMGTVDNVFCSSFLSHTSFSLPICQASSGGSSGSGAIIVSINLCLCRQWSAARRRSPQEPLVPPCTSLDGLWHTAEGVWRVHGGCIAGVGCMVWCMAGAWWVYVGCMVGVCWVYVGCMVGACWVYGVWLMADG